MYKYNFIMALNNLTTLINECDYIKQCSSNKSKDLCSLSSLIKMSLSQSDCIKLGIGCEKLFCDIILKNTTCTNIKRKNKKGQKETDHLFCDQENKVIYYAELKANINLDTEKSKSTYQKCLQIESELKEEYPGYEIKWCLLAFRFIDYEKIPPLIQKKYIEIKDNLFGINQYLKLLNIDLEFSEETYSSLLNQIADAMFSDN